MHCLREVQRGEYKLTANLTYKYGSSQQVNIFSEYNDLTYALEVLEDVNNAWGRGFYSDVKLEKKIEPVFRIPTITGNRTGWRR
jgi:hypothetical protein